MTSWDESAHHIICFPDYFHAYLLLPSKAWGSFLQLGIGSDMTTEGSLAGKILPAPLAHEGKVILQPLAAPPPGFSPFSALPLARPLLFLSSVFLPFDLPASFNILNTAGQTACRATGNSRSAPDGQSRPVNKRKFCMSQPCLVKWTKLLCHRGVSVNAQIRQAILRVWLRHFLTATSTKDTSALNLTIGNYQSLDFLDHFTVGLILRRTEEITRITRNHNGWPTVASASDMMGQDGILTLTTAINLHNSWLQIYNSNFFPHEVI